MESLDRRLSQLLAARPDLLLAGADADRGLGWQLYVDACVLRRRRLNRRLFSARRRLGACPRALAGVAWRAALLLALLCLTLAAVYSRLRSTGALVDAAQTAVIALRRLSVPLGLHRLRYLQDLAVSETPACLVPNPLARWRPQRPPEPGNATDIDGDGSDSRQQSQKQRQRCCLCNVTVRASVLRNVSAARANYRTVAGRPRPAPFLVTNAISASGDGGGSDRVTYAELRSMYLGNRSELESSGYNWVTRLSGPADVSGGLADLFADPAGPPAASVVVWRAFHAEVARQLRRLVPRPAFVGREMEIGLFRELVFLGANSGSPRPEKEEEAEDVALPLHEEAQNVHATMLDGQALLSLAPRLGCDCPAGAGRRATAVVHMRPGQLLFFRNRCHQLRLARPNGVAEHAVLHISSQL